MRLEDGIDAEGRPAKLVIPHRLRGKRWFFEIEEGTEPQHEAQDGEPVRVHRRGFDLHALVVHTREDGLFKFGFGDRVVPATDIIGLARSVRWNNGVEGGVGLVT